MVTVVPGVALGPPAVFQGPTGDGGVRRVGGAPVARLLLPLLRGRRAEAGPAPGLLQVLLPADWPRGGVCLQRPCVR